MRFEDYSRLSLARKREHQIRKVAPPPREFLCLECRRRIPHEQAAAHAARCRAR